MTHNTLSLGCDSLAHASVAQNGCHIYIIRKNKTLLSTILRT